MVKSKNYFIIKKGFTLIEIIISIAILGITSVAFLTMFTSGIVGIENSGNKSVSHYTAQGKIENNIIDSKKLPNSDLIKLTFSGKEYNVSGNKIDVTYTYGSIFKKLTTFTTNQ